MSALDELELIFHEALQLPAGVDRAEWLVRRCPDKPELRADVESLLKHNDLVASSPATASSFEAKPDPGELPDEQFGPYQPIRLLGRGGTSVVYLATRTDGQFEKNVAVKVMSAHLASDEFLRRFRAEGRFLAALQHTNITAVLDGGVGRHSNPYLVMEYVDGEPINRYCDRLKLNAEARLRLFLQVLDAVEYAHRNLILHRDLKPANILVNTEGSAKLLDFGTAALIADGPAATLTSARMLTPRYASPEQLRGDRPGIPSDIFSLGVILYELLTGVWPFGDPASVVVELRRAAGDAAPAAPALPPDLAAIVLKALETDPARRYPTAVALAADITRFLEGQPVEAQPQTLLYRTGKFLRRRWLAVTAAAVFVIGLSLTTAIAIRQAKVARQEALRSEQVSGFLGSMLSSAGSLAFDPQKFTVVELLEKAEMFLAKQPNRDPQINAMIHRELGISFSALQRWDQARSHLSIAISSARQLGDKNGLAISLGAMGILEADLGHYDAAIQSLNEGLSLCRGGGRCQPTLEMQFDLGLAEALAFYSHKDLKQARSLLEQAISLGKRNPDIPPQQTSFAMTLMGGIYYDLADWAQAERFLREALATGRAADPDGVWQFDPLYRLSAILSGRGDIDGAKKIAAQMVDVEARNYGPLNPQTASAKIIWADYAARTGEAGAAAAAIEEAMPIAERAYPAPSPSIWRCALYAAVVMRYANRPADAERYARQALAAPGTSWPATDARWGLTWEELGDDLAAQNKNAEAVQAFQQAVQSLRIAVPPSPIQKTGQVEAKIARLTNVH